VADGHDRYQRRLALLRSSALGGGRAAGGIRTDPRRLDRADATAGAGAGAADSILCRTRPGETDAAEDGPVWGHRRAIGPAAWYAVRGHAGGNGRTAQPGVA